MASHHFRRAGLFALAGLSSFFLSTGNARAASCAGGYASVCAAGCTFTTISAAIVGIPATALTGDYCVDVKSNATFAEQVTVQGKNPNNFQIIIGTTTGANTPVVAPPAASTAAFQIMNASVTLANIMIRPSVSIQYGVWASSSNVTISSVNVDSGGKIWTAGLAISSNSISVSYSSVTVQNADGILVAGQSDSVSYSSMTASSSNNRALYLNGASSGTFTGLVLTQTSGSVLRVDNGGAYNTISLSTMTNNGANPAVDIFSSSNTFSQDYFSNPGGPCVELDAGASYNLVKLSTAVGGAGAGSAGCLLFNGDSFDTVTQSMITSQTGDDVNFINTTANDTVSQSTITEFGSCGGFPFQFQNNPSSHTLTRDYVDSTACGSDAIRFVTIYGGGYNTISFSTINAGSTAIVFGTNFSTLQGDIVTTQGGLNSSGASISGNFDTVIQSTFNTTNAAALLVTGTSATISNCYIQGSTAVWVSGAATGTTVSNSTMSSTLATGFGLYINTASNTVTGGYIHNTAGFALRLDTVASYNTLTNVSIVADGASNAVDLIGSSNTVTGGQTTYNGMTALAVNLTGSYNTISQSTISGNTGTNNGNLLRITGSHNTIQKVLVQNDFLPMVIISGGSYNTISQSTSVMINGSDPAAVALNLTAGASSNTITACYLANQNSASNGGGVLKIDTNSNYNTVSNTSIVMTGTYDPAVLISASGYNVLSQDLISSVSTRAVVIDGTAGAAVSNSVLFSTATSALGLGIMANQANSSVIDGNYVQGSTAVWVTGSTSTVIDSNVLVSTGATAAGIWFNAGGMTLTVSSNAISGNANAGIYLDNGNSGAIVLSTNNISGAVYGVYVATQAAGATLWITSNTIIPSVSATASTYGLFLNGLQTGTTVENNSFYYRSAGSLGGLVTAPISALSSAGLKIDHNRFNNPGLLNTGTFYGIQLVGVPNATIAFNDFNSTGALGGASVGEILALRSSTASIRNNIFMSSMTGSVVQFLNADAVSGFSSDYNDWFSLNASSSIQWGASTYPFPWSGATGQDVHSIAKFPYWANNSVGTEDFHPMSRAGRCIDKGSVDIFNAAAACPVWDTDSTTSLTVDAADPTEAFSLEPAPNGSRANMGCYGNTVEASKTHSVVPAQSSFIPFD